MPKCHGKQIPGLGKPSESKGVIFYRRLGSSNYSQGIGKETNQCLFVCFFKVPETLQHSRNLKGTQLSHMLAGTTKNPLTHNGLYVSNVWQQLSSSPSRPVRSLTCPLSVPSPSLTCPFPVHFLSLTCPVPILYPSLTVPYPYSLPRPLQVS